MADPADRSSRSGRAAPQDPVAVHLRTALQALLKEGRRSRLYGARSGDEEMSRFKSMYLAAIDQALAEQPVVAVEVTTDALSYAGHVILGAEDKRGDLVDTLYAEGVRGVTFELGVTEGELLQFGNILLTPYAELHKEGRTLEELVWEADFTHIFFAIVERLGDEEDGGVLGGDSPLVKSIAGLVEELNRTAGADAVKVRQDEFVVMRRLQEELGTELVKPEGGGAGWGALDLSPALRAEVAACEAGEDLDEVDVVGLLAALVGQADDQHGDVVAQALFHYAVGALEGDPDAASNTLARLRAFLDGSHDSQFQRALRLSARVLAAAPLDERLATLVTEVGETTLRGPLFLLFGTLGVEGARLALAAKLPAWAIRVLADAWLVDDPPADLVATIRRMLTRGDKGGALLGLALASRSDQPQLIDALLQATDDVDATVRELALVALRRYQTPRLREVVHRRLVDPTEGVRLEALRYVVAYREAEALPQLERRLLTVGAHEVSDAEVRALCIAIGRLGRDRGESFLIPLALGARPTNHPALGRAALDGLRAVGSTSARAAISRIAAEVPALADHARVLLGGGA